MDTLASEELLKGDERILAEAKRRFTQSEDWEGTTRNFQLQDIKFANGDSDNLYQWPDSIRRNREVDSRPCLTVNKVRTHILMIVNDIRQNKPGIKYRAVGDGASFKAAEVLEGVARHIEYISNASDAYINAVKFQVEGGIGYLRVATDYMNDESFDQEIFIRPIKDAMSVYLDPDINEKDGSDAKFGFIFENMPRDEFNLAYPKYKDLGGESTLENTGGWFDKDHVRVAEYFRKTTKKDKLYAFKHPITGQVTTERHSKLSEELLKIVIDDPETNFRTINDNVVEYFLIVGSKIAERNIFPGKYIPIVRVVGDETIIDGELDRKGHTRNMKDPQRIYNYWTSNGVEFIALQSKSPYITPALAIEGYETYWAQANNVNHSFLPYNHIDKKGNPIPTPVKQDPPTMAPAYIEGLKVAQQEMMMASGQYEATFGQKSNETSGRAINERQAQGDIVTAHFKDNFASSIKFLGKIILDLIPKIYDTERVLRILAEDGTESYIQLDPQAKQAYQELQQQNEEDVKAIFNPNVGRYDVIADSSSSYATRREEAFNQLSTIMQSDPGLAGMLGDLWAENSDIAGSDKIAERFRNMLPPQATGAAPPAQIQQMQQQMQQMQQGNSKLQEINGKLLSQLAEERIKSKDYSAQKEIDVFKAYTDRMEAVANILEKHVVTPRLQAEMLHELAVNEHKGELDTASTTVNADLAAQNQSTAQE